MIDRERTSHRGVDEEEARAQLERPPLPLGTAYNVLIPHPFDETSSRQILNFHHRSVSHPAMNVAKHGLRYGTNSKMRYGTNSDLAGTC